MRRDTNNGALQGDWRVRFERVDPRHRINILAVRARGSAYKR
jgi:hypothetical protein